MSLFAPNVEKEEIVMMLSRSLKVALLAIAGAGSWPAAATETITYTYDAKGRVVQVVRTGTVNNNGAATYQYDKADNRKQVTGTAPH